MVLTEAIMQLLLWDMDTLWDKLIIPAETHGVLDGEIRVTLRLQLAIVE